jgi:hypothetical protein
MAKLTHNNSQYMVYKDITNDLELIMGADEEKRFQELVREYKGVENIPDTETITGVYLNKQNRQAEGFENDGILAKNIRFSN